MGSDAITNSRLSPFTKDSARKKKGSRLSKLKQDKVDLRREQWVSQAKNKGYKVGTNGFNGALPQSIPKGSEGLKTKGNLPKWARRDKNGILGTFDGEAVSWMSSTICRNLARTISSKDSSRSRSSYSGSCSSSCTDGERDEGCLDDWEAMADALTAETNKHTSEVKLQHSQPDQQFVIHGTRPKSCNKTYPRASLSSEVVGKAHGTQRNIRAWSAGDVFRPESLPSLLKQKEQPLSCPICCEDLDPTDSSFLPCPCGFQLCLFCHKRILEVDARCPGCRKQYDSLNPDM